MEQIKALRYSQWWVEVVQGVWRVYISFTIRVSGSLVYVYWDPQTVPVTDYLPVDYCKSPSSIFYFGTGCQKTCSVSAGTCTGGFGDGTITAASPQLSGGYSQDNLRLNVLIGNSPNTRMQDRATWQLDLDPPISLSVPCNVGLSYFLIGGIQGSDPVHVFVDGIEVAYQSPWLKSTPGLHLVEVVQGSRSASKTVNVGYDMDEIDLPVPQQYGSVQGHITSDYTGLPVAGAQAVVERTGQTAITDSSGYYRIDDIPVGDLRIDCYAEHFVGGLVAGYLGPELVTVDIKMMPINYNFVTSYGGTGTGTLSNWPPGTHVLPYGYPIVRLKANSSPGSYFDHWDLNGVLHSENPMNDFTIGGDTVLVAYFTLTVKRTLTISYSGAGKGTTNPPAGSYQYDDGSIVSVSANPDAGSAFDHWEVT